MHKTILSIIAERNQFVASKEASMTNERFSKKLIAIMDQIVAHNAKYDRDIRSYDLPYEAIDDLDLELLTAQLFVDQEDVACESTSADNDRYYRNMLPALIKLLENSTDKDSQSDFIAAWKTGAASYAKFKLNDLLQWRLEVYNADILFDARGY